MSPVEWPVKGKWMFLNSLRVPKAPLPPLLWPWGHPERLGLGFLPSGNHPDLGENRSDPGNRVCRDQAFEGWSLPEGGTFWKGAEIHVPCAAWGLLKPLTQSSSQGSRSPVWAPSSEAGLRLGGQGPHLFFPSAAFFPVHHPNHGIVVGQVLLGPVATSLVWWRLVPSTHIWHICFSLWNTSDKESPCSLTSLPTLPNSQAANSFPYTNTLLPQEMGWEVSFLPLLCNALTFLSYFNPAVYFLKKIILYFKLFFLNFCSSDG